MKTYNFSKIHILEMIPMQFEIIKKHKTKFFKEVARTTWIWFSSILSLIVTIVTIGSTFKKDTAISNLFPSITMEVGIMQIMGITALVSIIVAILIHWPKIKSITNMPNVKIIIECCDLLKQEGLKVIHSTDTFDMKHIMPGTLVDQFIHYCNWIKFDLKKAIRSGLDRKTTVNDKTGERFKRYELGTTCDIRIGTDVYCLVAFTRWNENEKTVELSIEDYKLSMRNMWDNLADPRVKAHNAVINVTIMGNKFINLPSTYDTTQKIGFMLETFFEVNMKKNCCRTLRICIGKEDAADIDFTSIDTIIKYIEGRPK